MKSKWEANDVFKADTNENLQRCNEWMSVWEEQLVALSELCEKSNGLSMPLIIKGTPEEIEAGIKSDLQEFRNRLEKIKVIKMVFSSVFVFTIWKPIHKIVPCSCCCNGNWISNV